MTLIAIRILDLETRLHQSEEQLAEKTKDLDQKSHLLEDQLIEAKVQQSLKRKQEFSVSQSCPRRSIICSHVLLLHSDLLTGVFVSLFTTLLYTLNT